jgi:hypothetical protein
MKVITIIGLVCAILMLFGSLYKALNASSNKESRAWGFSASGWFVAAINYAVIIGNYEAIFE